MATPRKATNPRSGTASRLAQVKPGKTEHELVEIHSEDFHEGTPVPLFKLDGVLYSMPGTVPTSVALELLDKMTTGGELAAMAWMMATVVGPEAWEALKSAKAVTPEQLTQIIEHVSDHALGALEGLGKG